MDQVVDEMAGANPEQMDTAKLQLAHQVIGLRALAVQPITTAQPIGSNQRDVAHRTIADSVDQCLTRWGVAALQSGGDLDVLLLRFFPGCKSRFNPPGSEAKGFSMKTLIPLRTAYSTCTGRM